MSKVTDVLEDEEQIKKIMDKYNQQEETKEEYQQNIIKRIKNLCEVADVDYEEYVKALGASKYGYSIIQRRGVHQFLQH